MKWSYRLGRIAGVDVYLHVTFGLLVAWVLLAHAVTGQSMSAAMAGLAFIAAIFACVLLHEFGHALAARRFGIATRDITLLPIGGAARLERMPENPVHELVVALAGPMVNVLIAGVLWAWLVLTNQLVPLSELGVATGPFVERLLIVNVLLIVFNLIPAFPMDGGRCVRALLAMKLDYAQATRIAAGAGQVIAAGFVVLGLFTNPFLLLIGVFVWLGAGAEARHVTLKAALRGIPAEAAVVRDVPTLSPSSSLAQAAELLRSSPLQIALVLERERVLGILSASRLVEELRHRSPMTRVGDISHPAFRVLELPATLEEALAHLQEERVPVMPVLDEGRPIGLITLDMLERFMAINTALMRADRQPDQRPPIAPAWPTNTLEFTR